MSLKTSINAFFAISYAPFLIPGLIKDLGISEDFSWFFCCISIAASTIIASFLCQRTLLAGPSIAAITIISEKIVPRTHQPSEIAAIILATGILILASARINLHKRLLQVISKKTKIGFKAGIGLMFIITSLAMVPETKITAFLILIIFFHLTKKQPYIAPITCAIITIALNQETSYISHINPKIFIPEWNMNIIQSIIILFISMLIDGTITSNTLNPNKEHKGLNVAGGFSTISSIIGLMPCNIYLETLIFTNKQEVQAAYYCGILFLILGLIGSNFYIPSYLTAALLASLGYKILLATNPKIWIKSPSVIMIAGFVGLLKSFILAIGTGIIIDSFSKGMSRERAIWMLALTASIIIVYLK